MQTSSDVVVMSGSADLVTSSGLVPASGFSDLHAGQQISSVDVLYSQEHPRLMSNTPIESIP